MAIYDRPPSEGWLGVALVYLSVYSYVVPTLNKLIIIIIIVRSTVVF